MNLEKNWKAAGSIIITCITNNSIAIWLCDSKVEISFSTIFSASLTVLWLLKFNKCVFDIERCKSMINMIKWGNIKISRTLFRNIWKPLFNLLMFTNSKYFFKFEKKNITAYIKPTEACFLAMKRLYGIELKA